MISCTLYIAFVYRKFWRWYYNYVIHLCSLQILAPWRTYTMIYTIAFLYLSCIWKRSLTFSLCRPLRILYSTFTGVPIKSLRFWFSPIWADTATILLLTNISRNLFLNGPVSIAFVFVPSQTIFAISAIRLSHPLTHPLKFYPNKVPKTNRLINVNLDVIIIWHHICHIHRLNG